MGIRRRIVLSFLALFALVVAATAFLSTLLVADAVKRRQAAQTANLAALINGIESPVLRNYLPRMMELSGAEAVRVGTLVEPPGASFPPLPDERVFPASTRHGDLTVVYSSDVISREKTFVLRPFAIVAVSGMALFAVLGYLMAQAIARPLERLAGQAQALPGGDVQPVGGGAELARLVEALNRMLAEVRRTERLGAMGRMAAGVAHEIRNPLSAMKMTVQLLRGEAREPEPFDRLLQEIERLELAAAELTGVSQPLRRERVPLGRVVDEVLALMSRQLDHLGIRVEKRYAPAPDAEIDATRFKRCIMNLVLNGAQAMPAGGPLTVEVGPRGGRARLAVTDAGGGVPEAVRDRIFEPFVTTKQDGVGLGLALTRRIVEDHGGKIGFDPAPGGTTFWIEV
jgi:signal transduction histidine kinase